MSDNTSYIIVGSGAFGASTALHLIRKHPGASIYLLDRDRYDAPTRVAASWDWNKVIRADYNDIVYAKLAAEAQDLWRTDPIWKPFYHESGVLWISPTSFAQNVLRNNEALGVKADVRTYSVEEARTLCDGLFKNADYTGVSEVLVNRSSGWAEAKEALQSTIEASIALGVKYVTAEVAALIIGAGASRRCCGVVTGEGTRMHADKIILCTGAFTPRLLLDSAPGSPDLHAGKRILAAGVTEATATLTAEELPILDHMPVAINDNPVERGM
jgi:glycine/D-amino acid oxidase-like deaminating enzyme